MFWANVNNELVEPTPNKIGVCPLCEGKVHSKCGKVNTWHWAHYKGENCDSWYEPESYWHLNWKKTFGSEYSERVLKKNGVIHRADILTENNVVIELQNSPIQSEVIYDREEFYGDRMIWLINGTEFKENFLIDIGTSHTIRKKFRWYYYRRSWQMVRRPVFIDFGHINLFWVKDGMGTAEGYGYFVSKEKFITKYNGNFEYYQEEYQKRMLEIKRRENRIINQAFYNMTRNRKY